LKGERRDALQKEEDAPSVEERRAELRAQVFDYTKQRRDIALKLKVN
jgi:hypothetical protein